jgi:hypothetical protein
MRSFPLNFGFILFCLRTPCLDVSSCDAAVQGLHRGEQHVRNASGRREFQRQGRHVRVPRQSRVPEGCVRPAGAAAPARVPARDQQGQWRAPSVRASAKTAPTLRSSLFIID